MWASVRYKVVRVNLCICVKFVSKICVCKICVCLKFLCVKFVCENWYVKTKSLRYPWDVMDDGRAKWYITAVGHWT